MAKSKPQRDELKGLNPELPLADREPVGGSNGDKDITAAGTPGGGSSFGGLGGTNIGEGDPSNADLEDAMGDGEFDDEGGRQDVSGPPYAGHAGGAVGGTPAEGRATGGNIHGGLAPGGAHRGDSTLGSNAPRGPGRTKAEAERIEAKRKARGSM
jgi:hypothetical protein